MILGAVLVFTLLTVSRADAARGGKTAQTQASGAEASIAVNQASPVWGDTIDFTTSGDGKRSHILLACYQGGLNLVYVEDQPVGASFSLGGADAERLASGGSGTCYAYLYNHDWLKGQLALTYFVVGGS